MPAIRRLVEEQNRQATKTDRLSHKLEKAFCQLQTGKGILPAQTGKPILSATGTGILPATDGKCILPCDRLKNASCQLPVGKCILPATDWKMHLACYSTGKRVLPATENHSRQKETWGRPSPF